MPIPVPCLAARVAEGAARRDGSITFVGSDPALAVRVPWAELHADALAMAGTLQARGVGPGAHVALLGPTSRPLVTAIQATWLAGGTVMVLPLPMRIGSIEELVAQTRARIRGVDAALVLVDADLAPFVSPEPGDPPFSTFGDVTGGHHPFAVPEADPDRLAILQFTSGATADPKGVMLTHRQVVANLAGVAESARLDPDSDVTMSWLPLYHDMGLIGLLTLSMITGTDLVQASPLDFLAAPARWMEWMSHYGGTATAGPNFAYAVAARRLVAQSGLDLSRVRIALNGAEPVHAETVSDFLAAGALHGLAPGAAFPAFGMAEVAIAGTFPEPGRGLCLDVVDRRALEHDRVAEPRSPGGAEVRAMVRLGRPVSGLEMRICDAATGDVLAERQAGELQLRGTSVTSGYYRHPQATADAFDGDWLRTGDLGYTADGELVVCGRIKDVIIVAGRNVFPEDVEHAASGVAGVRAGNVIAFGIDGGGRATEEVVVVAESRGDDHAAVRRAVAARILDTVGLPPGDIVLVQPGTLPKTSSGKLQRALCRRRYLDAALQTV